MGLPRRLVDLLREFVGYICEYCHKHEREVGRLSPHRLQRGEEGGRYILRNIKMACTKCHDLLWP